MNILDLQKKHKNRLSFRPSINTSTSLYVKQETDQQDSGAATKGTGAKKSSSFVSFFDESSNSNSFNFNTNPKATVAAKQKQNAISNKHSNVVDNNDNDNDDDNDNLGKIIGLGGLVFCTAAVITFNSLGLR